MTRARDLANLIGSGNYTTETLTATAGQTVFTPSNSYTPNFIQIYMNGLLLDDTVDYTATNGTTITLTVAASAGDEMEVVTYNTFSVGDAITQTEADGRYVNVTGDTITGDLSVGSNALFVDSTNNRVGVGTSSPDRALHVESSASGASTSVAALVNPNSGVVGTGARLWLSGANATSRGAYIDAIVQNSGNAHDMAFATNGDASSPAERMRITSTGSVGIGTSSPSAGAVGGKVVHVQNSGATASVRVDRSDATTAGTLSMTSGSTTNGLYGTGAKPMVFSTDSTERMRLDASGSLLVGQSTANSNATGIGALPYGSLYSCRDGGAPFLANRKTSNGEIALFQKDGFMAGVIGTLTDGSFACYGYYTGIGFGTVTVAPTNGSSGGFIDNQKDLGAPSVRWDDVYATNGTIQTSDANEKQQIAELTAAEIEAAKAISKLFKTFKWNDSVAEKGDAARIHTGVIAQEVEAAMTAAGLDAGRYAFFISSTWWESTEVIPAVEEVLDEEGNVVTEAQPERTVTHTHDTAEEAPAGAVERTRKGIRYPQLLAFIGAATEQRLASIEARLDALETV